LGFGMKWNMGWMHDTLEYFAQDPVYRRYHHDRLTFSLWYAFTVNFVLPLSHDEVVYGKRALCAKMPGDWWQQFANLRLLFGYMWAHPGKKLLFMGGEFGQRREWNHDTGLDWWICEHPEHGGVQRWVGDLNRVYRAEPALHELDSARAGFEWVDSRDIEASVVSFLRISASGETVLVIANFTPIVREQYRVGVPRAGWWRELLNSDAGIYGGSGVGNMGGAQAAPLAAHGRPFSLTLTLPPLAIVMFKVEGGA
jgi:1,4-alpha-glucan branching enzyme